MSLTYEELIPGNLYYFQFNNEFDLVMNSGIYHFPEDMGRIFTSISENIPFMILDLKKSQTLTDTFWVKIIFGNKLGWINVYPTKDLYTWNP